MTGKTVLLPHNTKSRYGQVVHKNLDPVIPFVAHTSTDLDKAILGFLEDSAGTCPRKGCAYFP